MSKRKQKKSPTVEIGFVPDVTFTTTSSGIPTLSATSGLSGIPRYPVVLAASDKYRIVQTAAKTHILETSSRDALGNVSWTFMRNVDEDSALLSLARAPLRRDAIEMLEHRMLISQRAHRALCAAAGAIVGAILTYAAFGFTGGLL